MSNALRMLASLLGVPTKHHSIALVVLPSHSHMLCPQVLAAPPEFGHRCGHRRGLSPPTQSHSHLLRVSDTGARGAHHGGLAAVSLGREVQQGLGASTGWEPLENRGRKEGKKKIKLNNPAGSTDTAGRGSGRLSRGHGSLCHPRGCTAQSGRLRRRQCWQGEAAAGILGTDGRGRIKHHH